MLFVDTYVYRRLPLLRALSRWLLQANCPSAWTSPARDMIETYDGYVVAEETALDDTVALLQDSVPAALRQRGVAIAERVRADYSCDRCAALLVEALRRVVGPGAAAASPARQDV